MEDRQSCLSGQARLPVLHFTLAFALLACVNIHAALSPKERAARTALLPAAHQQFVADVVPIINEVELEAFLVLETDAQRDVFIREFWRRRDVAQGTTNGAFKALYEERLEIVKSEFGTAGSDRGRVLLLHGEPDKRTPIKCDSQFRPIEVWSYEYVPAIGHDVRFIFFKPAHRDDFLLWQPQTHRVNELAADRTSAAVASSTGDLSQCMNGEELGMALRKVSEDRFRIARAVEPPPVQAEEDVRKLLSSFVIAAPSSTATTAPVRKLSRRERKDRISKLREEHRKFLEETDAIVTDDERDAFLTLETDPQRDVFIVEFWKRRDKAAGTTNGAFKAAYYERLETAREKYEGIAADRSRILLLYGQPVEEVKVDCDQYLQPIEIWRYLELPALGFEVRFLFFEPRSTPGRMKLWQPVGRGEKDVVDLISPVVLSQFQDEGAAVSHVMAALAQDKCFRTSEQVLIAIQRNQSNYSRMMEAFDPPKMDEEGVKRVLRSAILTNPDVPRLTTELSVRYPAKQGARTDAEITLLVPRAQLKSKEVGGVTTYSIDVTGEILRNEELYENYRYRFDYPGDLKDEKVPVIVDRFLRPGDYKSRIKITDPNSGAEGIVEHDLKVPEIFDTPEQRKQKELAASTIGEIKDDIDSGGTRLRIVPLPDEMISGIQKIETMAIGSDIKGVEFWLDGKKIAIKRQPPYTLDLDFGEVPRLRRIRAVAIDAKGEVLAGDDIVINTGMDPFRVRIVSPRIGNVKGRTRVEMSVRVPEGKSVAEVQLFLNETKMATLYDPPWVQTIDIPETQGVGYLRAVALLKDDPAPTEDVVMINSPAQMAEIDVHLIELPVTVLVGGKPVNHLGEKDFKVLDEGKPVKISRFEHVKNLPLSIGLAIDTSGSMLPRMNEAQKAAAQFFQNVMKAGDKAFVVGFDSQPQLVQKWSRQIADMHAGLAKLRAEEYTALYDAVIFSLYNFLGVKGQKALVLLSDGKDTTSKFNFDQTLEYARRAAVPIYVIGIGIRTAEVDVRYKLGKLASETGGNTYYIERAEDLGKIYSDIQNELRSQYVISFYPPEDVKSGSKWREVTVQVSEGRPKTIRGYYP